MYWGCRNSTSIEIIKQILELLVINCEINFAQTCFSNYVMSKNDIATKDTRFYVLVVTLSTQDNSNCCKN